MKANELRIGNWFRYQTKIGYDYDVFDTKYIQDLVDDPQYDFFESIPLTEDILLKCGFKEMKLSKGKYVIISVSIRAVQLEIMFGFLKDGSMLVHLHDCEFDLKHLHQLQNLYFSLTNEELTIKL